MKILKFALIALFLGFSLIGASNTDGIKSKPKRAVNMTYENAVKDPGLVLAIKEQVDPKFLNQFEKLYIVRVNHNAAVYSILGSRDNWIRFFLGPIPGTGEKAKAKSGIYRID